MQSTAGHWIALVSFVIAAISDFVDGWLARKIGLVTPMGKLLDPLADKMLVGSAFVYLSAEGLCPVWITVLILAREFLVTGLRQIAVEAGQVHGRRPPGEMENRAATHVLHHLPGLVRDPIAGSGESAGRAAPLPVASGRLAAARLDVAGAGADAALRLELHVGQPESAEARQTLGFRRLFLRDPDLEHRRPELAGDEEISGGGIMGDAVENLRLVRAGELFPDG